MKEHRAVGVLATCFGIERLPKPSKGVVPALLKDEVLK
jgi:hypothetical protein